MKKLLIIYSVFIFIITRDQILATYSTNEEEDEAEEKSFSTSYGYDQGGFDSYKPKKPQVIVVKAPAPQMNCPPKVVFVPKTMYITVPQPPSAPKIVVVPSPPVPPKVVLIKTPAAPPYPPKVILIPGEASKPSPPKVIIQKVPQPIPVPQHGWR